MSGENVGEEEAVVEDATNHNINCEENATAKPFQSENLMNKLKVKQKVREKINQMETI